MHYSASIIAGSSTDRLWRRMNRPSGVVAGVQFRARAPGPKATSHNWPIYFSEGELTGDQVMALQGQRDVKVDMTSARVLEAAPTPAPTPEPTLAPTSSPRPTEDPRRRGKGR